MAIWCFQVYPDQLAIVDYYEDHGMGFDHYCEWLDARGYHGVDWMPHDAKVREAGAPGARTRIETLISLGRKPDQAPKQSLMDGINAGRKTIPFARFDKTRTAQGLESLRAYRTEWARRRGLSRRRPTTTGPRMARTAGAACRSRGALRCASRSRRRCPSACPSRT
jgi:phage terminase large subunit